MPRAEVDLTDEEVHRLDALATRKGLTIAEVLHESVREYLGTASSDADRALAEQRALAIIGKFRSSVSDLASNHDRYLEKDFAD
jgi:hypothetical protein